MSQAAEEVAQVPFRDLEPEKAAKVAAQVPFRDLEPEKAAVMVHLILHYESFMQ
ncbi:MULTISPECIES: hypothetical protein [Paenibacillus]|uniref:hypothetical protein n=1 Tax=Paenibacillus TaxID=44249 RepID=UPI0004B1B579|nr:MULTISPECIES: hypothetical protein [Paenibacillus]